MCFPHRVAHITNDLWFPGRGAIISLGIVPGGENTFHQGYVFPGEVCVFQVEEHVLLGIVAGWGKNIPLGISVCQVGEHIKGTGSR